MSSLPPAPAADLDTWEVTRHGQPETLRVHATGLLLSGASGDWDLTWAQISELTFPAAFSASIHTVGQEPVVVGFRAAADQRAFRARAAHLLATASAAGTPVPAMQAAAPKAKANLALLTLEHVPGHSIAESLGSVVAVSVLSRNFISDFGSDLKNVLGGSLGGMETAIETAFGTAKVSLSRKASALGADAVIGLQLQLESVSDKAQAVMLIGTAVRITRDPEGIEPVAPD